MAKAIIMIDKPNFHSIFPRKYPKGVLVLPILISLLTWELKAETETSFSDSELKEVAFLNYQSPTEPSGSKGLVGTSMGMALRKTQLSYIPETIEKSNGSKNNSTIIPSFHFIKGILHPIDIGFSFSYLEPNNLTTRSLFLQWSLFQGRKLPCFSLRANYNELDSYYWHKAKGGDISLVSTLNSINHLQIYWGTGYKVDQITTSVQGVRPETKQLDTIFYNLGFKLTLPIPFFGLTLEYSSFQNLAKSEFKFKTSLNI